MNTIERDVKGQPITKRDVEEQLTESGESAEQQPVVKTEEGSSEPCHSGIWLFTDRENITHFFAPNFLPPYNTPAKRKIIMDVLKEEWDENALSWKPCGEGSMTKKPAQTRAVETPKQDDLHLEEKKSGDSLAITLESGEKHPVEETNGESQTHPYFKTLDTLLKDVMSHAHLAANVCAGQFEKDESVHALEDK